MVIYISTHTVQMSTSGGFWQYPLTFLTGQHGLIQPPGTIFYGEI